MLISANLVVTAAINPTASKLLCTPNVTFLHGNIASNSKASAVDLDAIKVQPSLSRNSISNECACSRDGKVVSDGGTVAKTKFPGWRSGSMDARRLLSEVPPGAAMLAWCDACVLDALGWGAGEGVWGWSWCNNGYLRPVCTAGRVRWSFGPILRPTMTWHFEGVMEKATPNMA